MITNEMARTRVHTPADRLLAQIKDALHYMDTDDLSAFTEGHNVVVVAKMPFLSQTFAGVIREAAKPHRLLGFGCGTGGVEMTFEIKA